jgi:GT2 family glycosyltransferase
MTESTASEVTLSIIILNYNSGNMLVDCLDSIFADEYPFPIEVIVPDNASTDNSLRHAEEKWGHRIRVRDNGRNGGFAWGNNLAIREARGKYICALNPDTIIHQGAFPTLVAFMEEHPKVGFCGPKVLNKDGTFQLSAKRSIPTPFDAISRALLLSRLFPQSRTLARYNTTYFDPDETRIVDASTGCCMLARKEMLDEIGLLDESYFIYCEDVDWFLRAKRAGWEVWYIASAVIEHHHAYTAAFRKKQAVIDFHASMLHFYRKHYAADYPGWFNVLIYTGVWARKHLLITYRSLVGNWDG